MEVQWVGLGEGDHNRPRGTEIGQFCTHGALDPVVRLNHELQNEPEAGNAGAGARATGAWKALEVGRKCQADGQKPQEARVCGQREGGGLSL